jgi:HD-GYP domain-containing protein (c-di-GMP phosphodiesterase class II)
MSPQQSARKGHKSDGRMAQLQSIAVKLIQTHDFHELLDQILNETLDLMKCDAGSLYIKNDQGELIFEVSANRSMKMDLEKRVIPLSGSGVAVHCFREKKSFNISDVRKHKKNSPFQFNRSFDEQTGYRSRSMLLCPLLSSRGEALGVIQVINRKQSEKQKWPSREEKKIAAMPAFSKEDENVLNSISAIASAALENARLYSQIERLFEGFVKASVNAVEARDPATAGHSERVSILTVSLAELSTRSSLPEFRGLKFSKNQIDEIRYAALLHDFGKIGVREQVLVKEKKLYEYELEKIQGRLERFKLGFEVRILRELLEDLAHEGRPPLASDLDAAHYKVCKFCREMDGHFDLINKMNQPRVLEEDLRDKIDKIRHLVFADPRGGQQPLLSPQEAECLLIKKGSLNEAERLEIESHVTQTYLYLKQIPWTQELSLVPEIAYFHHEKLDGSGYPTKAPAAQIPLPAQMMTICDIFDALVANDRHYKAAVPLEKALDIIADQVKRGQLNQALFKIFLEAKIYTDPAFLKLMQKEVNHAA